MVFSTLSERKQKKALLTDVVVARTGERVILRKQSLDSRKQNNRLATVLQIRCLDSRKLNNSPRVSCGAFFFHLTTLPFHLTTFQASNKHEQPSDPVNVKYLNFFSDLVCLTS